jgi:hypothetical protein
MQFQKEREGASAKANFALTPLASSATKVEAGEIKVICPANAL